MKSKVGRNTSVLVIDDDAEMLQLLRRTLELEDFDVELAADGAYGMSVVRRTTPDLILLDITMPGPDGYQVLESIRQCCDAPVIMVTAKNEVDSVDKAIALGADDYVRKPFRPLELVARIRAKLRYIGTTG